MKLERPREWFPEPGRTDPTYANRGEKTSDWLSRSTVPRARDCRRFLNDNLSLLPGSHQSSMYRALGDRWHSAFFELVVARTLQVLGANVEVEPDSDAETRIDFLARFPDSAVSVIIYLGHLAASAMRHDLSRFEPLRSTVMSPSPDGSWCSDWVTATRRGPLRFPKLSEVFEGRAAIGYDHGYDAEVFYLGLTLDPAYVEGCPERIGEDDSEEERLFRDLWEDETQWEVVIESLKTDCEVRTGRPSG